jgi:hypothetical protein
MSEPAGKATVARRWAGNAALALGAVLVALLVAEIVIRLLGISYPVFVWTDPVLGVGHIPGARSGLEYEGRPWIEINSDGWRGPEVPLEPDGRTYRIALLGDSYIEAFEVPFEKTLGELVELKLARMLGRPVEVLNFGHGGYGTTQEQLVLRNEVWKYSPDLVLLAVTTGNDISDNSRALKRTDYVPYHVYQGDRLVLDTTFLASDDYRNRAMWTRRMLKIVQYSRLAQVINRVRRVSRRTERQHTNRVPGVEVGLRDEVQVPPKTAAWKEAWRVTEGVIRLIRDDCRNHGVPFGLITLTRGIQVTPIAADKAGFLRALGVRDLYYPDRRLAQLGEREGFPVLNLAPKMAEIATRKRVYFHAYRDRLGVGHWSEAGHAAAADLVAPWIASEIHAR